MLRQRCGLLHPNQQCFVFAMQLKDSAHDLVLEGYLEPRIMGSDQWQVTTKSLDEMEATPLPLDGPQSFLLQSGDESLFETLSIGQLTYLLTALHEKEAKIIREGDALMVVCNVDPPVSTISLEDRVLVLEQFVARLSNLMQGEL